MYARVREADSMLDYGRELVARGEHGVFVVRAGLWIAELVAKGGAEICSCLNGGIIFFLLFED